MEKLESQGKVISELHDDKLRGQGAKAQWKLIAGVTASVYTLMQIAMLILVVINARGPA